MRVAVLTMTRDRLPYTQHCFASLKNNSGADYDHYVLDQGSTDGTVEWLLADESLDVTTLKDNIGICAGLNLLLDEAVNPELYDVLLRFDNDCEVLQPDTLRTICQVAVDHQVIVAPKVLGLNSPPRILGHRELGDHVLEETAILGGIFMAIPAQLFSEHGFRYDERHNFATGDEAIVPWYRLQGGHAGYLQGFEVNHYETTQGQIARFPEYHERKVSEMAA